MCLNWATGVRWGDAKDPLKITTWDYCANSAFYIPKRHIQKFSDAELDILHKSGIYYNRVHSQWDGLFLNNTAQAILVRKQPIRFDGDQALALPSRTECLKRFVSKKDANSWVEANKANDGFMDLLDMFEPDEHEPKEVFKRYEANLINSHKTSPLSVERCLELLQGPTGKPSNWYDRYELAALQVASEDSPRRVTTHQEKCTTRHGVNFRMQRVQASYEAATLYTQSLNWPIPLKDIGQGFEYHWCHENPHTNVVPLNANYNPATLIYLPSCIPGEAETHYSKLAKCLQEHVLTSSGEGDFIERLIRAKDRLCVVYREHHQYKILHESDGKKSITIPAYQSPTSFDKEDDHEC